MEQDHYTVNQILAESDESTPLLAGSAGTKSRDEEKWKPGPGFVWIEIAIFSNVFLSGFDGTITASTYAVIGSEFNAANTISWLTTSYLITSTAFQPLYGRFSDILGRRTCFFTATITFLLGCLGCGFAPDIITLNLMRALTGLGGGGLMTMATIINSDMIPFQERGMYQACQNVLHGFGSICGASLGGLIADHIGWRWCFLLQVPASTFAFVVGHFVIKKNESRKLVADEEQSSDSGKLASKWDQIDLSGAILLVLGLSTQLGAMTMGGNNYPWSDVRVIVAMILSVILIVIFVVVELRTKAVPVMPMSMLHGTLAMSNQISNVCVGMAAYSFLFISPLFFQVVLRDNPSEAGMRLVIPSLATPAGGLLSGIVMSRWGRLSELVRAGCFIMMLGNGLVASLQYQDASWKYIVYLFPANFGQGICYPAILFTFLAAFDHSYQAVSTSTVYLFRSMGTVWGVAASSTLLQNILAQQLPSALEGVTNKDDLIDQIRHSVAVLDRLPPDVQSAARHVYYRALKYAYMANTAVAAVALLSAFFARGKSLHRK
ncbi:uncharacterized protein Z520_06938 [Fonsecaea multimorphosa CBS 102226]|uniref:Major facilitator superfamily (MFS) profile domain-containing protein n=1 Tax=Fonsecaea multimorphosa CBS 102226 TaxID=1442371 RepID=A0A0D2IKE0_9EURO|nr:uncharacterized protein Z520_06938 [Fonsecaea multimorphosa CBS 102226]KIX97486.1 hypothetical protein Z520_06938 [Fonsecaea multimorphosa CBS 102226]OAL23448.1 hypothetical protein AYO22_06498 [Fonsecaea multimorphosa]